MPEPERPPPSASNCRLRFFFCLISALVLAGFGFARWSPFTDFKHAGSPDASPLLATLDFGAAAAFFLLGPAMLAGWRGGKLTRPEREPEFIVMAIGSLTAGGIFILLLIGASRGLLKHLP